MRYVVNTPALNAFGRWVYIPITVDEARAWLRSGDFEPAITLQSDSLELERQTGVYVPVRREKIQMRVGDIERWISRSPEKPFIFGPDQYETSSDLSSRLVKDVQTARE